ncbi:helix-turn-helix domain-containing protein [Olsenella uli]|uniref:helix-turn-helix domain-containing protein n=1 Tax=Olsenella uli TaxID=133926 RepID=UPI00325FBB74
MLGVKYELDRLGMTQAAFAEKARVSTSSLSRIVNGKEPAYPKRGRRIAEAMGWRGTLDELFGELEVK